MDINSYQTQANRTLIDAPDFDITPEQVMQVWNATGLAGEAGEVSELIKKGIFHQQGIDTQKMKKELGDVLWYVAALCKNFDIPMEEVMQHNIDKLKARFPEGWDPKRSTFKEGIAN